MNPGLLFQIIVVVSMLLIIAVVAVIVGFVVRKRGGDGKKWRNRTGSSLLAISTAIVSWIYFVNPLPSDEAMIEHFSKYRAEYEELAAGGIHAKKNGDEAVKAWLASPRTLELKKSIRAKDERNVGDESGQWFAGVQINGFHNSDKGTVNFHIENGFKFSWREMNSIWKIYMYLPEPLPETEGKPQCPVGSGRKCLGDFYPPLIPSLNGYPEFYEEHRRNCGTLSRKIDEHWYIKFIRAC